ncbi:hypothetical protein TWF694_003809 [Orbilia ellipsospora]|uniref:CBM1 domain-containing protein n=1 Tax=Orbilia ellipsospora TaxID=2528407 RepID=A0AAV9X0C0_9PEZI
MLQLLWIVTFLLALVAEASVKVRVQDQSIALANEPSEPNYELWTVNGGTSSSFTSSSGVVFKLSVPSSTLRGSRYKLITAKMQAWLGERVVGEGMSTDGTAAVPITLTLTGLPSGTHTLLTYHNAWDALSAAANIKVTVNGATAISSMAQTVRKDNIWDAASSYVTFTATAGQAVTIVYTPLSTSGVTDLRAFVNAWEIDLSNVALQARFSIPGDGDEHYESGGAVKWQAPKGGAASYDVYLGTNSNTNFVKVSSAQTGTSYTFSGLNTMDTYYWRVDPRTSAGVVTQGRPWMFRLAQLAFPEAQGWGRFARGGRGGKVVKVTSLADTLTPGTFRYAVESVTGPRNIIFDIGGVITLTSRLSLTDDYVTVAGQTAPGKGIAIIGWPFGLSGARDAIVRHMRVRPGKVSGQTVDGMGLGGCTHTIMDRCSMGWGIDESHSSRNAGNITFMRNMISEPLNVAGHQNYPPGTAHGYAASIGGDISSYYRNLIAHAEGRSWSMAGGAANDGSFAGRLDIRNNVVYNFGGRVTDGGAHQCNFVGNMYKRGAASGPNYDLIAQYEDGLPGTQTYYCASNSMPGLFSDSSVQVVSSAPGACTSSVSISPAPTYQKFYTSAFFPSYITETLSSTEAYKRVLSDSGAQSPVLDDHDKRIIKETKTGTYTYKGSVSGKPGLIDNEADCGGLESFPTTTRASDWDKNGDGIADWWDGSTMGTGYTVLDSYLNWMADPHLFVTQSSTTTIDLNQYAQGFVAPITFTVSVTKGTVTLSGTNASYKAPSTQSIDTLTIGIKDAEGSTWSRKVGIAIFTSGSITTGVTTGTTLKTTTTAAATTTAVTTTAVTTTNSTTTPSTTSKTTTAVTTTKSTTTAITTSPPTETQTLYGQCGGIGFTGPTVCANTYTCSTLNPYYYQCL